MKHLAIETQSSAWTWLGPALLFLGAMITLWVTTTSANKREWNKWRRDTLIKLCADAVEAARDAESKCQSALSQKTNVFAQTKLTAASMSMARIQTISEQLYLMGANNLGDTCVRLKDAADAINMPASHLRTARINAKNRQDNEFQRINSDDPSWREEGSAAEQEYHARLTEMSERIHREVLAEPEDRYNTARSRLEDVRAAFIKRGRTELKSSR